VGREQPRPAVGRWMADALETTSGEGSPLLGSATRSPHTSVEYIGFVPCNQSRRVSNRGASRKRNGISFGAVSAAQGLGCCFVWRTGRFGPIGPFSPRTRV